MPKPQSKTQKKLDSKIRELLTRICEHELKMIPGFSWITHQADFSNFPASLIIVCVFDTEESKQGAAGDLPAIYKNIQAGLLKLGVVMKHLDRQIFLDSDEACNRESEGNWNARLKSLEGRAIPKNFPKHNQNKR
ncbi:hypothetical protein TDB9533_00182 [Thalassocella blandensis]|nr:hypothetical protein TDB9533_00182 [Thalassocella blandensis]